MNALTVSLIGLPESIVTFKKSILSFCWKYPFQCTMNSNKEIFLKVHIMSLTQTVLSKYIVGPNPRQTRILGQNTDSKNNTFETFCK